MSPSPSPVPGFPSPAAGTEAPLAMLATCHERLRKQCATLRRLLPHVAGHGADAQAQEAATAVLRYFDRASPQHHADEEQDLFPALLESMAGSDAVCLREMTEGFAAEHRALESAWRRLRGPLQQIAAGETAVLPEAEVEAFVALNEKHSAREDDELLPMAARLLDDAAVAQIGEAMRARRERAG
jgi:hemerythrin-like domain-containing protein